MESGTKSKASSSTSEKTPVEDGAAAEQLSEFPPGRHVDWRMLPFLGLLYAVALIDRTNLGIARIVGMGRDLNLQVGERYSIVSCLYFVPYILLQIPSNAVLRMLGARTWLTICVVGWGTVQLGMGFVENWGQLAICRVLLGVFEAGFFPALVYIITTWYAHTLDRPCIFYLVSIVIGGFSAIFAYALTFLGGRGGLAGWQWIFVIEGIITIVLGILTFAFVADFPDKNTFLTVEQTRLVLARVEADRGDSVPDKMTLAKVFHHLSDWTTWAFAIMFMCATMPAYAISYFIPIILASMGWGTQDSLLLSAPPFVFAAISTFFFAWLSDRSKKRAHYIVIQTFISLIGLFVTGYAPQDSVRYFGIFLTNAGASGCIPAILAYRAVSTAAIIAFGGIGGIFATTVYRQQDAPRYLNGIWATIACQFMMLLLVSCLTWTFIRRNHLLREGKLMQLEGQPGFFYTI
ncbi:major facilitator superfamily domain-containing protein [Infundibulicybe gibba]|nr:major facilitator superfamily domain-containing protein [Infundibulicybe gibba]